MVVSIEISYYPLCSEYNTAIDEFLHTLPKNLLQIEVGTMSTIITGEFDDAMREITASMKILMEQYPSVFTMKISNSCTVV